MSRNSIYIKKKNIPKESFEDITARNILIVDKIIESFKGLKLIWKFCQNSLLTSFTRFAERRNVSFSAEQRGNKENKKGKDRVIPWMHEQPSSFETRFELGT